MKTREQEPIEEASAEEGVEGRLERLGIHARWFSMVLTPTLLIVLASRGDDAPWGLVTLVPWSQFWLVDGISQGWQRRAGRPLWRTMMSVTVFPWHLGLLILILAASL